MTPDDFLQRVHGLAPGAVAKLVLEARQVRLGGNTFATLGWPDAAHAVIKVDPARQTLVLSMSQALSCEPGRRRKAGIILIRLAALEADVAAEVIAEAVTYAQRGARRAQIAARLVTPLSAAAA
ncbi:MmcQ/YjbR family DNA-binding protein [Caulobacter endophyticus]|uniref:YjbR protein n=1 Tax=Caulobacter endophyticus TaxID=2172652 RepID=A0A2T9KA10_9CAUL|nr:MmcQ/YjbR family DNA-binding protein [Caulobacter endophyticus]PVM92709.1 hypothetical protein DDF67_04895 [Caulobacter endophyticus]